MYIIGSQSMPRHTWVQAGGQELMGLLFEMQFSEHVMMTTRRQMQSVQCTITYGLPLKLITRHTL